MTVLDIRNDPTQKTAYLDGMSDADCHAIQAMIDAHDMPCKSNVVYTKDQVNDNRKAHARWVAHASGNAYVLYVQNRTSDHSFRVQAHGKNVFQAVRRYYRGLDNACNWIWKCTQVVAVYECVNKRCAQAGKFLFGKEQESAPW